jgi:diguanylate cyclase
MGFELLTSVTASPETWLTGVVILSIAGMGVLAWSTRPRTAPRSARAGRVPATGSEDFDNRALQLDREAAAILELVQSYIEAGQKYSVTLAEADKSLPKIATPEEMGVIVKFLISENAKMQCEANDLRERLEESQSQIEKLCSNLAEARETGLKDPLTSLSNRRCFDASLASEIAEAARQGTALCLVMIDLDNFKQVNDEFGHLVGDEILKLFATALRDNVGSRDSVARYGGEEFAIILPGTELDDAKALTERVRCQLEARELVVNDSGRKIGKITASFGIAQLREGEDAQTLVERADVKLYEAKCAGRNRVAADAIAA